MVDAFCRGCKAQVNRGRGAIGMSYRFTRLWALLPAKNVQILLCTYALQSLVVHKKLIYGCMQLQRKIIRQMVAVCERYSVQICCNLCGYAMLNGDQWQ